MQGKSLLWSMRQLLAAMRSSSFSGEMIETTVYEVCSLRVPAAFDGFRIVQISDLHYGLFERRHDKLLLTVRHARPDLIAITGDLVDNGEWNPSSLGRLFRDLQAVSPIYFVSGNHESKARNLPALITQLEEAGVRILDCEDAVVERGRESISVAGISDPDAFRKKKEPGAHVLREWEKALRGLRRRIPSNRYAVLLSHRPELLGSYTDLGFDLVLTGHAHGGLIRLPFTDGAIYAPNQGFFPRYTSGVITRGRTRMVVSRGLGGLFPPRLFNREEIVVARLRAGKSTKPSVDCHGA